MTNAILPLTVSSASCDRNYVIAMYMTKTSLPLKCYTLATYANYFMHTWHKHVSMYASCELNAISNVSKNTGIHTFHTIHIYPKKYVSHITCMSHHTTTVVYIEIPLLHIQSKTTTTEKCNFLLPCYCQICANNKYAPEMPNKCHIWK